MSISRTALTHGKRWLLALSISALSLSLIGCGDGDSAPVKQQTVGGALNGAQPADMEIQNTSGSDIKSLQVDNASGKQLAQSSFDCAKGATCKLHGSFNEPVVFKFLNKDGIVIGAYILSKPPKQFQHMETSTTMLGLYVFGELQKRYPEQPQELLSKVNHLFSNYSSPDGSYDKLAALGEYYRSSKVGSGLSDDQFYKDLHEALNKNTVLPVKPLSANTRSVFETLQAAINNFQLIPEAQASYKQDCSPYLKTGGTLVGQAAAKAFPPAAAIPGLINGLCKGDSEKLDQILNKLNEISKQIDGLSAKLSQLNYQIAKLQTFMANARIKDQWESMETDQAELEHMVTYYQHLVPQGGTLADYVKQQGGLEKAYKNSENFRKLMQFREIWTSLYTNIDSANRQSKFADGLNLMCDGTSDSGAVDLMAIRGECNSLVALYQMMVVSENAKWILILQDLMTTVEAYRSTEGAWITNNLAQPGSSTHNENWSVQYETVKGELEKKMANALDNYADASVTAGAGYFDPTAGLPKALLDSLPGIWCRKPIDGSKEFAPNITGWVKNGDDSYITVQCLNHDSNADGGGPSFKYYKSRYYYVKDGDQVVNLLGVLAPSDRSKDRSADQYEYSIKATSKGLDFDIPLDFGVYITDDTLSGVRMVTPNPGKGTNQSSDGSSRIALYRTNKSVHFSLDPSRFSMHGKDTTAVYVRYTDQTSKLSYVWKVVFWRSSFAVVGNMSGAMICITANCDKNRDAGDELSFYKNGGLDGYDGPKAVWFSSNGGPYYRIDGKIFETQ